MSIKQKYLKYAKLRKYKWVIFGTKYLHCALQIDLIILRIWGLSNFFKHAYLRGIYLSIHLERVCVPTRPGWSQEQITRARSRILLARTQTLIHDHCHLHLHHWGVGVKSELVTESRHFKWERITINNPKHSTVPHVQDLSQTFLLSSTNTRKQKHIKMC